MVQPQAGKHVTMVTLAGKGGDSQQIQVHIGTGERVPVEGQSLSSGFWGSMILTWVNGKRPRRPFTSPSH